jgi:7,8-dihydropterin-6-yl-methyl-4-(beta-D-ribofuranosyl)aminobenzene 5'-phosphate synthase
MPKLKQLERLIVDVLVDNQSDSYSSKPPYVSPEFNNVIAAGATEISGTTLCCAQLGLSLMLTGHAQSKRHKLLFDAGPEGDTWLRNCKCLGIELTDVDEIAISHGHWDHMGALTRAVTEIIGGGNAVKSEMTAKPLDQTRRKVPCHVNPGMFIERGARLSNGSVVPFELVPSPELLSSLGAEVISDYDERLLLDEYFYLSGEIPRITAFEKGRQDHLCRDSAEEQWRPDPLLMDERYLAAHVRDKGLIVFSSCSHAGIINVLHHLRATFGDINIYGVFGGLHLVGTLEKIIPETVEQLKTFRPTQIMPGHCTGWRAVCALVEAFGESLVVPSAVGSRYTF